MRKTMMGDEVEKWLNNGWNNKRSQSNLQFFKSEINIRSDANIEGA